MKKIIKIIVISFTFLITFFLLFNYFASIYSANNRIGGTFSYKISSFIPSNLKNFLKKNIYLIPTLKRENKFLKKTVDYRNYSLKHLEGKYNLTLEHELESKKKNSSSSVLLKKILNKTIILNEKKLSLSYFQVSSITNSKHTSAGSTSTSYLESFEDKIIFLTGDGNFYYFLKSDLQKKKFNALKIKSNIGNFINYPMFYKKSLYGIKDLFIKEGKIFFTASLEKEKNCFNTGIYSADVNFLSLNFTKFYQPSLCVKKELAAIDEFSPYPASGRLFDYDKDHILFSVGEWNNRPAAQDISNNLGKIIKINQNNLKTKIVSMGHRNVQGLYYDSNKKIILSTEHGPIDGDEININKKNAKEIVNFGWPISSYGNHYGEKKWLAKGINQREKAPLYKSHKKHGFEEPIKFYNPALGISQIIKISKKFNISGGNEYFIATMGGTGGGGLGLRYIKFDENYNKILKEKHFYLKERVRDIIYDDDLNQYLLFFETSGSIVTLKNEN